MVFQHTYEHIMKKVFLLKNLIILSYVMVNHILRSYQRNFVLKILFIERSRDITSSLLKLRFFDRLRIKMVKDRATRLSSLQKLSNKNNTFYPYNYRKYLLTTILFYLVIQKICLEILDHQEKGHK